MCRVGLAILAVCCLGYSGKAAGAAGQDGDLAAELRRITTDVFGRNDDEMPLSRMLPLNVLGRLHSANQTEAERFERLTSRDEWERFRDVRLAALRRSLHLPDRVGDLRVRVTQSLAGDGYVLENLVFESRPGLWVAANLYRPERVGPRMPGIVICHSFHHPKTQGELQDMGMSWARAGSCVLVIDQLNHGERRQHPFTDAERFPAPFPVARQDYLWRYNTGIQLALAGESLMGWMVWDLLRGVDLLLSRPGIDKDRIILLGSVAGGGDPAAVAAAVDPRIAAVVPFNFGGPEPETGYPLPEDAERTYPYARGHWDSTRRLYGSARAGFLPWVIVGAAAPRPLIYAHEFAWDRERDPAWDRLQTIYDWYGRRDHLEAVSGRGTLFNEGPGSTGCANIHPDHRTAINAVFDRWFDSPQPAKEIQQRRPPEELLCLNSAVTDDVKPRLVHELATELASQRIAAARARFGELPNPEAKRRLRAEWSALLGDVKAKAAPRVIKRRVEPAERVSVERIGLEIEAGIVVPVLLLIPKDRPASLPVVVGVAQQGKGAFLRERATVIAALLDGGASVCLADVRGTGETTAAGDERGPPAGSLKTVEQTSSGTLLASGELMLGSTLLGARVRDLRAVAAYLRSRDDLDSRRIALWGDSFAPVNLGDVECEVPWGAQLEHPPHRSEPLGGLLALLGGLFEDDLRAVAVCGSFAGYETILESPFCHVPYDVIVPGALTAGDLTTAAAALAPLPLHLSELVDGRNRRVDGEELKSLAAPVRRAYTAAGSPDRLRLDAERDERMAAWLLEQLKSTP